jgi:hypothetical protein
MASGSSSDSVFVDVKKLLGDNKPSKLSSLDELLWVDPKHALDPMVRKFHRFNDVFWAMFSIASAVFVLYFYLTYRNRSTDGIFPLLFGWCVVVTIVFTAYLHKRKDNQIHELVSEYRSLFDAAQGFDDGIICETTKTVGLGMVDESKEEIRRLVVSPKPAAAIETNTDNNAVAVVVADIENPSPPLSVPPGNTNAAKDGLSTIIIHL